MVAKYGAGLPFEPENAVALAGVLREIATDRRIPPKPSTDSEASRP
jgi:hypothetical protein